MTISVTSTAFENNTAIPERYTGDGANVSPPLKWTNLPEGTKELALIADDPDAPRPEPWVHWVIYKIPPTVSGLPEGVEKTEKPGIDGAVQGQNTAGEIGYQGPAPPAGHGEHHYHFKLYALDTELDLGPGADKQAVLGKIEDHVLARGELVGTYQR